jgi:hypothetical protein
MESSNVKPKEKWSRETRNNFLKHGGTYGLMLLGSKINKNPNKENKSFAENERNFAPRRLWHTAGYFYFQSLLEKGWGFCCGVPTN